MENSEDIQVPTSLPTFIIKLWNMVCNPDSDDIITWSICGNSFVIKDQIVFYTTLLPTYYKHNNMTSFIRQLNLYGFHKIPSDDNHIIEFYHPYFQKDEPKKLSLIKRKIPSSKCKSNTSETSSADLQNALSEAEFLKEKQNTVDSQLAQLQQENSALWYELNELRVKHKRQSKIVSKLVQFLVNFLQPKLKDVHNKKPHSSDGGATIFEVDGEAGASDCWRQIDEKMIEDKSNKLTYEKKMIKDETKKTEAPKSKEQSLSVINNSNPVRILNEICNMTKLNTVGHSGESISKKVKLGSSSKTYSKQLSISNSADSLWEILEQSLQNSVENDEPSIIYSDPNLDTGNRCPAIDYKKPNQRKNLQEACGSKLPKITTRVKKDVATVIDDPVSQDIQNDSKLKRTKKVSKSVSKNAGKVTALGGIVSIPDVSVNAADILSSNEAIDVTANKDCQESQKLLPAELNDVINMPVSLDVSLSDDINTLFAVSQNNPIVLTLPENHELQNDLSQKEKVPITAEQLGLHVESMESDLNNLRDFLSTYEIDPDAVLEMLTNDSNSGQTLSDGTLIKVEPTNSKQSVDSESDLLTCTAEEADAHSLDYIDANLLFNDNYEPHQTAGTSSLTSSSKKSLISRKKNLH